jgi:hypothetical protein
MNHSPLGNDKSLEHPDYSQTFKPSHSEHRRNEHIHVSGKPEQVDYEKVSQSLQEPDYSFVFGVKEHNSLKSHVYRQS